MTPKKVSRWRKRYLTLGLTRLEKDAPRAGRKPAIGARQIRRVVEMTTRHKPPHATHWSTRTMAAAVGISEASVRRIWHAHGLRPHLLQTFKVSRDPKFAEKLEDIVGPYLNPPEHPGWRCAWFIISLAGGHDDLKDVRIIMRLDSVLVHIRWSQKEGNLRSCALAILIFLVLSIVVQTAPASASAQSVPAWSPSKDIGVFVFGKNGQNPDQQLKDESECYGAAKQMTGIDPKAPAAAGKTAEQTAAEQKEAAKNADQAKGARAAGAARGAAGGAAIGAIAGNAGKGAGAGAVAGTMRGGMQQRQANAAAQKQAAAQTSAKQQKEDEQLKAAHAQGLDTFQRAFEACMDARGYSVK